MVSTIKMIHPEIIKKVKDISVTILIPDGSCISCLEFEIPNISKLYESFPDLVTVYTFGDSEVFKGSEFSFKSESIDSKKKLFDRELEYSNPIVALTNHKGEVIQFYIAEIGRSVKSDNFYERLGLLLGGI